MSLEASPHLSLLTLLLLEASQSWFNSPRGNSDPGWGSSLQCPQTQCPLKVKGSQVTLLAGDTLSSRISGSSWPPPASPTCPRKGSTSARSNLGCKRQRNTTPGAPWNTQHRCLPSVFSVFSKVSSNKDKISPIYAQDASAESPRSRVQPLSCTSPGHRELTMTPPVLALGRQSRGKHKPSDRQSCQSGPDLSKD